MSASAEERAATFRRLHQDGLLVLANAWDAGSARLIESLGAKAVATTSAGVAWSHGYPDGDQLPVRLLVATVASITRIVKVPLTVDVEGGYSTDPAAVGEAVAAVVGAGAVGINLEDGGQDPDLLCAKIESAKRAATRAGVDLFFVNARTDVYLRGLGPDDRRVETTLARAERYRAAGADGLFIPGLAVPAEIRAVAAGAGLPLNVMAWPGLPPASELMRLGVRRLSAGSSIAQAALARTGLLAAAFLQTGASDAVRERGIPYAEINALMAE
jgi:2-methylisocitrate lyase-like PEP mutase family enzyme